MHMYKCEDCGLITSEELFVCPKCNSEKNKLFVDLDEEAGVVYQLNMKDVECVIEECFNDEQQEEIRKYSDKEIQNIMSRKLEIEWTDCVEAVIRYRILNSY